MSEGSKYGRWIACAGLIAAPALWSLSTELGLSLPNAQCNSSVRPLLIASALLLLLSAGSGVVSWRAPWAGRVGTFTARMCALVAAVLCFAMLLQALASAMLTGCER